MSQLILTIVLALFNHSNIHAASITTTSQTMTFFHVATLQPMQETSIDAVQKKSRDLASKTMLEAKQASTRWSHAKELLGKYYKKSVVKVGEGVAIMDDVLLEWTQKELKGRWKNASQKVVETIIAESDHYGFDPVFLMAVIKHESKFDPEVIGSFGEIGLMQITPQTADWITRKYDIPWKGAKSLKDPATNIRIGSAYMAYLREKFGFQGQLYLAAYNMGSANVMKALKKQIRPKDYSNKVLERYVNFYSALNEEMKKNID